MRLNAVTGALQASLNFRLLVPAKCEGPGAWSSPAIDPTQNSVFIGTFNDNCGSKYQDAILRLDASTLKITSIWQVPPSQHPPDSDFGASPMLFSAVIGGVNQHLVGAVNKNGVYYALDRADLSAGPVWTYTAAKATALASQACGNIDAISSSTWAGPGSPVMVAGLTAQGSRCLGTVAALNPSNGQPEWQTPPAGQRRRSPYRGAGHSRRRGRSNGRSPVELHRPGSLLIQGTDKTTSRRESSSAHPPASSGRPHHRWQYAVRGKRGWIL